MKYNLFFSVLGVDNKKVDKITKIYYLTLVRVKTPFHDTMVAKNQFIHCRNRYFVYLSV